ncbi:hypothetical protein ACWCXB_31360 [Streptomyces sp. NPDC001514]
MDLVGARYGALGVLHESGDRLEQFITAVLRRLAHLATIRDVYELRRRLDQVAGPAPPD